MSVSNKHIQPYTHTVFTWTKHNNILLNPDKTTFTLFTPDPAKYTSNLDLKINNTALPMTTHPKVLGLTLDPKLTSHTFKTTHYTKTHDSTNNKNTHRNRMG